MFTQVTSSNKVSIQASLPFVVSLFFVIPCFLAFLSAWLLSCSSEECNCVLIQCYAVGKYMSTYLHCCTVYNHSPKSERLSGGPSLLSCSLIHLALALLGCFGSFFSNIWSQMLVGGRNVLAGCHVLKSTSHVHFVSGHKGHL